MEITREVLLDAGLDEVWAALTDGDELSAWFGGEVSIDPRAGGSAAFVDGGVLRRATIDTFDEGRRLGFWWWPDEDPAGASHVELTVERVGAATRLVVTEVVPTGAARPMACSTLDVGDPLGWTGRLLGLELRFVAVPAAAC
jgi:uncharacterized protein YndB with AHSA1/START domain